MFKKRLFLQITIALLWVFLIALGRRVFCNYQVV